MATSTYTGIARKNSRASSHHLDWAHGFPFAALGLSDKYDVPLPSIVGFGFGYDEHMVESTKGELWPGVKHAEREAAHAGTG